MGWEAFLKKKFRLIDLNIAPDGQIIYKQQNIQNIYNISVYPKDTEIKKFDKLKGSTKFQKAVKEEVARLLTGMQAKLDDMSDEEIKEKVVATSAQISIQKVLDLSIIPRPVTVKEDSTTPTDTWKPPKTDWGSGEEGEGI